jgi:flagellar motor protein MotB
MRPWIFLGLAACVSKGRYEIAEVQLDATRLALSARTAETTRAEIAAEAAAVQAKAEIDARQIQLDALTADLAALRAERDALLAEKAGWMTAPASPPPELAAALALAAERQRAAAEALDEIQAVSKAFAAVVASGGELRLDDGVAVSVPSRLLFQEGWTTLSPRGQELTAAIVEALRALPGRQVEIVGHADPAPVHSSELPSAWERGLLPAVALAREIQAAGLDLRLTAASRAAGEPPRPGADADRVELWIRPDPQAETRFAPRE